jgi:hypothetical protein
VLAADAVAALHAAAVLFMVSGSLLALRWPRLFRLHVPVTLAILGIYLTGSDCPLTTLELWLRDRAGMSAYSGGFIGHYVTEPLGFPIHATSTQVAIYVVVSVPNAIGYAVLVVRRAHGWTAPPADHLTASASGRHQVPAELLEQPDEVVVAPPLGDPAVGEPVHVDAGPANRRAGRRDTR